MFYSDLQKVAVMTIYKAYTANLADHISVEVGPEEIIHLYPLQILPLAVQLGIISDYTRDLEVIYTQSQDGYFSRQSGEWVDMPDLVTRVEFSTWLARASYDDLERIATEFLNQKNKQNGNSSE